MVQHHHLGNHTAKYHKDNLPVFPDEPEFAEKFQLQSGDYASPSTSKQLPHDAGAGCQVFEEEKTTPAPWSPRRRV